MEENKERPEQTEEREETEKEMLPQETEDTGRGTYDGQEMYDYHVAEPCGKPEEELDTSPLSMGDWLLTILASLIPCCGGIILYCYWAFSKSGNVNRRNYCRAALIVEAVGIVILLLIFIFLLVAGIAGGKAEIPANYYYGY